MKFKFYFLHKKYAYFYVFLLLIFLIKFVIINTEKEKRWRRLASRNDKKKLTEEDKFARAFYCQHARLGYTRWTKKANSKKMRRINKKLCKKELTN